MKKMSVRFVLSCALMMFANTIGVFADDCAPKPVCPPKPCCEPVCCPPMPEDCCKRNVCPPTGVITPKVDLVKSAGMEWFLTGDYTFWTAREDNIEFAIVDTLQGVGATQNTDQGQVYRPNNKWVSGFKVGLGTDFCHDGWDVYAEYTWFKSNSNKHLSGFAETDPMPGSTVLADLYWNIDSSAGSGNAYGSGGAGWRLNVNVVDLELGRNFYVSPRLMLRPFYGLKGAWNKQHMDVSFQGANPQGAIPALEVSTKNQIKNWGIGIRAGMDTSWHFCRAVSVIGDLALTGLWEQFKVTRFDTTTIAGVVQDSGFNVKESQYSVKPVIEWMLGLKWETGLSCDTYHLSITAAWEEQVWFGQNRFLRVPRNLVGISGDLSLQGLTVDVRFDF